MTIAIIDKYPILRQGLRYLLNGHFTDLTVIELEHSPNLSNDYLANGVDLAIMGLSQPGQAANLVVINNTKRCYPLAKLIAYDETPDPSKVLKYVSAGVSGYLSKKAPLQRLVDCIDDVLERKRYISQEIMDLVLDEDWLPTSDGDSSKNHIQFSPREYQVAQFLAEGMSTSSIAKKLERKVSTISTIKSNIFQKLQVDNVIKLREQIGLINLKSRK